MRRQTILTLLALCTTLSGCGKKEEPLPPPTSAAIAAAAEAAFKGDAATVASALANGMPADQLDEVILGCAAPSVDEVNIGRVVALRMGCGLKVPGWTVMRNCASGMQSIDSGIANIMRGRSQLVLAGGVLIALLALRRAWVARLMQAVLVAGALEWAWTTFALVQQRQAAGRVQFAGFDVSQAGGDLQPHLPTLAGFWMF